MLHVSLLIIFIVKCVQSESYVVVASYLVIVILFMYMVEMNVSCADIVPWALNLLSRFSLGM